MRVAATYFDGRSSHPHAVTISAADDLIRIVGDAVDLKMPFAVVRVDERLGHAARRIRLPDGAVCEIRDLAGLDGLLALMDYRDGWVDRLQRHRIAILLSLASFLVFAAFSYRWGLPWMAEKAAARIPASTVRVLSARAITTLDGDLLKPSSLDKDRQRTLKASFISLLPLELKRTGGGILLRSSPKIGPNAFTLPDGTVVLLDELSTLLTNDQVMAVLAHEIGHARRRHGLQLLLRSSVVGAFLTFYVGDISQLMTAAPLALIQARYSQQFEREADDDGAALLRQHGLSPALLADALERLEKARPDSAGGGYLSSHPATAARIARLRNLDVTEKASR
jgi:Zn-dependent protease with chaperone function